MSCNKLCLGMNDNIDGSRNPSFDLLQGVDIDTNFKLPDLQKFKQDRNKRNETLLQNLDTNASEQEEAIIHESMIHYDAAVRIQKSFRGYLGRKLYLSLLYDDVLIGETNLLKQQERQVLEGELLVDNYKIERELEDTDSVSRNRTRFAHANATVIQRAWRERNHQGSKEHICCACNDEYPDLYDYYSETQTICFCCDKHRLLSNKERISLTLNEEDFILGMDSPVSPAILPSPSVDWLTISSVLNTKVRSESGASSIDFEDLRNRLDVDHDMTLTFLESYESENNNSTEVEIYATDTDSSDYVNIDIEKVTDPKRKRSPDSLEPVEESTRVLKSLEIHQQHEVNKEKLERKKKESQQTNFFEKSIGELKKVVEILSNDVAEKNLELLKELMIRDDLYTRHEALLMDADDLAKKEQAKKL